ncbi:hypothetical protein DdX_14813 [Ditylenchus destructor]|uniref:Uncharacterized protein n=1 Tax=Ditylenchus destructor TaxID=166010 RepID=A0AAD4QVA7_9BILA|nr:hypothetical protein DdX_14813 [Ditylenchus destructor]
MQNSVQFKIATLCFSSSHVRQSKSSPNALEDKKDEVIRRTRHNTLRFRYDACNYFASLVLSLLSLNCSLSSSQSFVNQQWVLLWSFSRWSQSLLVLPIISAIWTSTLSKPSRRSMKRSRSSNSAPMAMNANQI